MTTNSDTHLLILSHSVRDTEHNISGCHGNTVTRQTMYETRDCAYSVTLRCVRITITAVEEQ
jgi:hypothetical protein